MKKFTSIAVVGLAAAIGFTSVAIADATVYGRVTAGATHVDNDSENDDGAWNFGATGIDGASGRFNGTRFGFKGDQDLGNGMSAGFQIEREVREGETPNVTRQRHNLVWLSGGWGKLTLGNQNNPYLNARNWDQSYFYGGWWGHGAGYRHEGINYAMSNGPFSLNIMAMASAQNEDAVGTAIAGSNAVTADATAGVVARAAITAGAGDTSGDDGVDGWIIHAGYDFGVAALNFAHQADNKDYDITMAAMGTTGTNADEVESQAHATRINNGAVDTNASRDLTAIGVNGSVGALDWYLAYQTAELNAGGNGYEDNDITSVGGFLGFSASDQDTFYAYYVGHSGDRETYNADGTVNLGEDYTETIVGYSRDMGPGLRFIAEYQTLDRDREGSNVGSDTTQLALAVRYVF